MSPRDRDDWESTWVEFGSSTSGNPARAYRSRLILNAIPRAGRAPRVIDFGSGQGDLALAIRRAFPPAEIAGIELSQSGIERARRSVPDARFYQADLLEDGLSGGTEVLRGWADVAICSEVLEHVDRPEAILRNIAPYLKEGGRLILTVPGGPMSTFDRHIGHRKHYRADDLRKSVERSGYRVERLFAAGFPFFNLYKLVVMLRGEAVLRDASGEYPEGSFAKQAAQIAYGVFRTLFHLNLTATPWGWQMLLIARREGRQ